MKLFQHTFDVISVGAGVHCADDFSLHPDSQGELPREPEKEGCSVSFLQTRRSVHDLAPCDDAVLGRNCCISAFAAGSGKRQPHRCGE